MRAHAVTSGTHIAFARGRWQPHTPAGHALLAHELVHVAQVQAAGAGSTTAQTLWRAGEDGSEAPSLPTLSVEVTARADATPVSPKDLDAPGQEVDETGSAMFVGDIVALGLTDAQGLEIGIEADALPAAPERSEASTPKRLLLRVRAPAESVRLQVRDAAGSGVSAIVTLRLQPKPAPQGTVDPVSAAHQADRSALRAERHTSRAERRAERKALRGAGSSRRRDARQARREERRDERSRAREQRRARRDYIEQTPCTPQVQQAIDDAQQRGVQVCDAAIAALAQSPAPGTAALAAVSSYLKFDAADAAGAKLLRSVIDLLATTRNSLATADYNAFVCGDCDETSGAYVTQAVRGGKVTLCPLWRAGTGLKFDPARGVDDARAYALVHEFVHLSGPSVHDERYVSDKSSWAAVTPAQALGMADAYAAVAWAAGSGKNP